MISTIIKLSLLVIIVMIALNIFAPTQADKVLATFCKTVDIDKDFLSKNLNTATEITIDTATEVKDFTNYTIEEVKKNLEDKE